ncbi:hypothetical protein [Cuneatibacter caecimuris]|uniref:hypothetical protein n=1 Tax=Cuneatibacter caecimuris TaxID=1796618 RepID=UPI0013EEBB69|nr:hypothetical protein [Cuneatibacter caecimuris]
MQERPAIRAKTAAAKTPWARAAKKVRNRKADNAHNKIFFVFVFIVYNAPLKIFGNMRLPLSALSLTPSG